MNIYLLPGLGFDDRIFQKLDFAPYSARALNWIEPQPKELIVDYARRMAAAIPEAKTPVLVGHSMGGIMAQEIAAIRRVRAIVLLSSIRSRQELPTHFRVVKPLGLHRLFWKEPTLSTVKYWGKRHGYETSEELALFKSMVGGHSNNYLQWALRALSNWKEPQLDFTIPILQMHGSKDKTFPVSRIEAADVTLVGAGHLMLYKRPEVVSEQIKKFLVALPI